MNSLEKSQFRLRCLLALLRDLWLAINTEWINTVFKLAFKYSAYAGLTTYPRKASKIMSGALMKNARPAEISIGRAHSLRREGGFKFG
ncbi:hypothetical protein [Achromobacter sp. UBA4530]|uniref:hypothetical protein n=1 Tax=Achromobacter sp. UBA4530 TaxID=1945912 RepID=UPI00257D1CC4|nr:hypothetical protein [Achromobacter sp. UBA4530]